MLPNLRKFIVDNVLQRQILEMHAIARRWAELIENDDPVKTPRVVASYHEDSEMELSRVSIYYLSMSCQRILRYCRMNLALERNEN